MIRLAICEDERAHLEIIEKYIIDLFNKTNEQYEILKFSSGEELLKNYPKDIDIFILDVHLQTINGMDIARRIREIDSQNVEIIFITSLIDYMQEGYEVRAYRYLLKPIKYEDIKRHITSCIKELKQRNKLITVKEKNEVIKLKINEITYVEVQREDVTIHTLNKDYKIKSTITKIQNEINNSNFHRCHKSFLVNIEYIESIKQYVAILDNSEEVPISRHRFKDTKQKFFDYVGNKLC